MRARTSRFGKIGEIEPENPETWQGRLFLTFDLDWAIDPAIELCLDMVEEAGVAATFFVTHETPLLSRMRANSRWELGLHPNFNPLLDGSAEQGAIRAADVLERLRQVVPEARAVRSHSMTQSSRLLDVFRDFGLTHDVNHFLPAHVGIALRPFRHWNGLVRVPYCWEDDVALHYGDGPDVLEIARRGFAVFDFHPIHVALNTRSIAHYESTRHCHRDWAALRAVAAADAGGTRERLRRLLEAGE